MPESSKMQQRAAIIAILNKYRNNDEINSVELKKDINTIKKFQNTDYICKTLFREIKDVKSNFANVCAVIALEAIDNDTFEEQAIAYLQDKKISDDKKFLIVSLLRQKGIKFNYGEISNYVKEPEAVAQNGVKEFLANAIEDPEVQIDLLDFYLNIPQSEKISLLDSLLEEFEGDNPAAALSLLAQLNVGKKEAEILIEGLLKTASPFALEGLNHILENYEIQDIKRRKIEKTIKEIKFANPNFSNNNIIKNSRIYKCFIGFVDGRNDFSGIFSRKHADESIDAMLFTMNINTGINSCMGFGNITVQNLDSIVKRLYADSMPILIEPAALKALYKHYSEKSKKNQTPLPYETIVWQKLLDDIPDIKQDISEFLNSNLKTTNLTQEKVKKFCSSKMLETWYYSYRQNKTVDEIIHKIEENKIIDIDKINEIVSSTIEEHFINNKDYITELNSKLLILAYSANIAGLSASASCAYSLCFKNPYTKMLITSGIDKSLYYYFSTCLYECEEKNVFKEKNKIKTNFNKDELEMLMARLEEKWN